MTLDLILFKQWLYQGLHALNFPLITMEKYACFLTSWPRCGKTGKERRKGLESCQKSNLKNKIKHFITIDFLLDKIFKYLQMVQSNSSQ